MAISAPASRNRNRSPMLHSHSDGEFPLYQKGILFIQIFYSIYFHV